MINKGGLLKRAILLFTAVTLLTGVFTCGSTQNGETEQTENNEIFTITSFTDSDMKTGSSFPELVWLDGGEEVSLTSIGAKAYLIDFWATWCGPCRAEIPHLIELQNEYKEEGLVVIGISVDDNAGLLPAFISTNKINYMTLHTTNSDFISMALVPGGGAIPQTYILNASGKIVKSFVGFSPEMKSQMEEAIESILK